MSLKEEKTKKKTKKPKTHFWFDFVKITGGLPTLLFLRPKVLCIGNKKSHKIKDGVLISSNHTSYLDPVLMLCVFWRRRVHFLATKDLYRSKFGNWFFTQMHCIMVDKENFSMQSLHQVRDDLKKDYAVLIFPEGEVNREKQEMLHFKAGAVLMAHMSNKPILPVYIVKPKKWWHRRKVVVGDPIDVRALCGAIPSMDKMEKASEFLREKEMELMEYYQNYQSGKEKKNAKK